MIETRLKSDVTTSLLDECHAAIVTAITPRLKYYVEQAELQDISDALDDMSFADAAATAKFIEYLQDVLAFKAEKLALKQKDGAEC